MIKKLDNKIKKKHHKNPNCYIKNLALIRIALSLDFFAGCIIFSKMLSTEIYETDIAIPIILILGASGFLYGTISGLYQYINISE